MCDVQGTGANFLLAGIYFTFLFSLVIMVLTTAHFLAGAALEKVTANIKAIMLRKFPVIVAVFRLRIGFNTDPDPAFCLNADLDPRSQTNSDPCGYGSESWSDFAVTKNWFLK
jgi:hypothetical protein